MLGKQTNFAPRRINEERHHEESNGEDEKVSEKRIVTNSLQLSRMGEG